MQQASNMQVPNTVASTVELLYNEVAAATKATKATKVRYSLQKETLI